MEQSENLTVMFTDIVDFSKKTASLSRQQHRVFLADHDRLLVPLVKYYRGSLIKSVGDGMMIAFRSPTDALKSAMAMHDRLFEYNKGRDPITQIVIRVALNVGDVHIEKQDIFGSAVNLAARVESITPAGDIYFSQAVHLSMNQVEVDSERVGKKSFKGFDTEVDIYRVVPKVDDGSAAPFGVDFTVLGEVPELEGGQSRGAKESVETKVDKRGLGQLFGLAFGIVAVLLILVLGYLVFSGSSIHLDGPDNEETAGAGNLNTTNDGIVNAPPPDPKEPPPAPNEPPPEPKEPPPSIADSGPPPPPPSLDKTNESELVALSNLAPRQLKKEIEKRFLNNEIELVRELVDVFSRIAPKEPDNHLFVGHLFGLDGKWSQAIDAYERALGDRPTLNRDRYLNTLLLKNLGTDHRIVDFFAGHLHQNMVPKLAKLAVSDGLQRRQAAVDVLNQSNNASAIDWASFYLANLSEQIHCDDQKETLLLLSQLNDPNTVTELEKLERDLAPALVEDSCLKESIRSTITALK